MFATILRCRPFHSPTCRLPRRTRLAPLLSAVWFGLAACSDSTAPGPTGLDLEQVDAGYFHSCGLSRTGDTYCWGSNFSGLLGRDDVEESRSAVRASLDVPLARVDVGASSTCGLTETGSAWCWGHNDEGQLGDGSFADRRRPFALTGLPPLRSVSVGHAHACALSRDGTAYCWGDNLFGQLGRGEMGGKSGVPTPVAGGTRFEHLEAGFYATCGITTDGSGLCWGRNLHGQLGIGTRASTGTPTRVDGSASWRSIFPGDGVTCAVTTDGRTYCWGNRRDGLMGTARTGAALTPELIPELPDLLRVRVAMGTSTLSPARGYACGTTIDDQIVCWGDGVPGAGGAQSGSPPGTVLMGSTRDGQLPGTGATHLCVVRANGAALCGGGNFAGQLGDGTTEDQSDLHPVSAG